jgi:predicted glycosyltransferase involved in capsule biosynthesis
MEQWVKDNLSSYIADGVLNYYYTNEPIIFNMSMAKNLAHRLGTGEFLCNLDADNFLTDDFMEWSINEINKNRNIVTQGNSRGGGGRCLVNRNDFYAVGGYSENIETQSGDHQDFVKKLQLIGRNAILVPNNLMRWIDNTDEERYQNFVYTDKDTKNLYLDNTLGTIQQLPSKKVIKNFKEEKNI